MNDKIKHLLENAEKIDAIAQIKWRIENREQLREQRKKEIEELMKNNKQQQHTCIFEKSTTSNSSEERCKHCNNVRYTIDVRFVKNETYGGNK